MRTERSVEVARELAAVWEVLRDPALMPEWFDRIQNFVATAGDGTDAGDTYTIEYVRDSGPVGLSAEVLAVDAPHGHTHRFEGLAVPFTIISELDDQSGSTIWTATLEVKLSLIQRTLSPVIRGYLDDLADDMAAGFKDYMEA